MSSLEFLPLIITLLIAGTFSGFVAGLFGVGGGTVVVPIVVMLLSYLYHDNINHIQQIAVGTSFCIIAFTSFSSLYFHNKYKNIIWPLFFRFVFMLLFGVIFGAFLTKYISSNVLRIFFVLFLFFLIIKNIYDIYFKREEKMIYITDSNEVKSINLFGGGFIIGIVSSLVGIAGGSLITPFLSYHRVEFKKCIGTAAALGFPISIVGTLMYFFIGYKHSDMNRYILGYIHLPSVLAIIPCSILFAPLGARIAVKISNNKLKIYFTIFLFLIALKMIETLI